MQVLVVDDEQGIRDVVRRALEREAFEVLEAVDGQGAIAIADRFELALVILDLELPEMSGLDLLVALRARQPDLHVIILTGSGGEATRVTGLGRASCREKVCRHVCISVVGVSLKKKTQKIRKD